MKSKKKKKKGKKKGTLTRSVDLRGHVLSLGLTLSPRIIAESVKGLSKKLASFRG